MPYAQPYALAWRARSQTLLAVPAAAAGAASAGLGARLAGGGAAVLLRVWTGSGWARHPSTGVVWIKTANPLAPDPTPYLGPGSGLQVPRSVPAGWYTFCADDWDDDDATVLCRLLGWKSGQSTPPLQPPVGGQADALLLGNVTCPHQAPPLLPTEEDWGGGPSDEGLVPPRQVSMWDCPMRMLESPAQCPSRLAATAFCDTPVAGAADPTRRRRLHGNG